MYGSGTCNKAVREARNVIGACIQSRGVRIDCGSFPYFSWLSALEHNTKSGFLVPFFHCSCSCRHPAMMSHHENDDERLGVSAEIAFFVWSFSVNDDSLASVSLVHGPCCGRKEDTRKFIYACRGGHIIPKAYAFPTRMLASFYTHILLSCTQNMIELLEKPLSQLRKDQVRISSLHAWSFPFHC